MTVIKDHQWSITIWLTHYVTITDSRLLLTACVTKPDSLPKHEIRIAWWVIWTFQNSNIENSLLLLHLLIQLRPTSLNHECLQCTQEMFHKLATDKSANVFENCLLYYNNYFVRVLEQRMIPQEMLQLFVLISVINSLTQISGDIICCNACKNIATQTLVLCN